MCLEISQSSQENTLARASFLIKLQDEACNFIKKETLTQLFSCEFCEISKNTISDRTPLVAAYDFKPYLKYLDYEQSAWDYSKYRTNVFFLLQATVNNQSFIFNHHFSTKIIRNKNVWMIFFWYNQSRGFYETQ